MASAELQRLLRAGAPCRVEDLLAAYPAVAADANSALELIYTEFVVRDQLGQQPQTTDWLARFPQWRDDLAQLFEVHTAVAGASATVGEPRPGAPVAAASSAAGAVIGPYKLLKKIGEGGFGVVYLAEQRQPVRRQVAVKILKPGMDSRQITARFEAEQQALALMDHPNIARVFDGGQTADEPGGVGPGRSYFVMELVKGVPITEYCDQAQLATRDRLGLFLYVCQAVQHAHQKGIIHRDLKPSNVLATLQDATPMVKVIDFGVAKALGQQLTNHTLFTGFAQLVGTPAYMSPEQTALSNLDVDTRSDIYSLGVLLYELLTGTMPFDQARLQEVGYDEMRRIIRDEEPPRPSTRISTLGPTAATVATQRRSDPKRLSQLIRGELDWIVMRCLEKDRNRRYETASNLAADVQRYLRDEPVQACPPSMAYRLRKLARRHKAAFATAVAVGAAVLLSGGVLTATNVQIKGALDRETQALESEKRALAEMTRARNEMEEALKREQRTSYCARVPLSDAEWRDGNVTRAQQLLDSCPAALRGFEWHYLNRRSHIELVTIPGPGVGLGGGVAISPDGSLLAAAESGKVQIRDIHTGHPVRTLPAHNLLMGSVAFHPDGRQLAAVASAHATVKNKRPGLMFVWDVATGQELHRWPLGDHVTRVVYSPDGKSFALAFSTLVYVCDAATGQLQHQLTVPASALGKHGGFAVAIHDLAFRPDGQRLAAACGLKILVWDTATGELLHEMAGHTDRIWNISYRSDGRWLASAGNDSTARVWDTNTGRMLYYWQHHAGSVGSVCFHPHTSRLASGGFDNTVQLYDADTGANHMLLRGHTSAIHRLVFHPDGARLASGSSDATIRIWDTTCGQEVRTVGRPVVGHMPKVSPDGRRFASFMDDQTLRIADVQTGQRLFDLPVKRVYGETFSPDGHYLGVRDGECLAVWDVTTGQPVCAPRKIPLGGITLGPGGQRVASHGNDWTVAVREIPSGNVVFSIPCEPQTIGVLTFSPDGRHFALGDVKGGIRLWDARTGQESCVLNGHTNSISHLAFDRDSKQLASASADNTIRLWDVSTGRSIHTLGGHGGRVVRVAFSPDSKRIASLGADRRLILWDSETGTDILALRIGFGWGWWPDLLAFSADGQRLLLADVEQVRAWDATPLDRPADQRVTPRITE
jgi:WD40 repeat protein/serine/threonine protein kinase